MKLSDILNTVSAVDAINIQNSTGSIYNGCCQDFKATCEGAYDLLDKEVGLIRPYKNVLIIGLD